MGKWPRKEITLMMENVNRLVGVVSVDSVTNCQTFYRRSTLPPSLLISAASCGKDGNWVLAGVTSGGSPVCNVKKPSVYTRVSEFRDWISENTGGVAYRGSSGFLPGPCPKGAWC